MGRFASFRTLPSHLRRIVIWWRKARREGGEAENVFSCADSPWHSPTGDWRSKSFYSSISNSTKRAVLFLRGALDLPSGTVSVLHSDGRTASILPSVGPNGSWYFEVRYTFGCTWQIQRRAIKRGIAQVDTPSGPLLCPAEDTPIILSESLM